MTKTVAWLGVWMCSLAGLAHAQATTPTASTDAPPSAQVPPPPSADVPPPPPTEDAPAAVPEPPAAYTASDAVEASTTTTATTATQPGALPPRPPVVTDRDARKLVNIWLGIGYGDALGCGGESPTSTCAVEGAGVLVLGVDYRFLPLVSVGLELGGWGFAVSNAWRGQLDGEPTKAEIAASYIALIGRVYPMPKGILDPYVQLGLGVGGMVATASNDTDTFEYTVGGFMPHIAGGIEFHVHPAVRLGPQLGFAGLLGGEICTRNNDEREECRKPETKDGKKEGRLAAWRFMLSASIMFGQR